MGQLPLLYHVPPLRIMDAEEVAWTVWAAQWLRAGVTVVFIVARLMCPTTEDMWTPSSEGTWVGSTSVLWDEGDPLPKAKALQWGLREEMREFERSYLIHLTRLFGLLLLAGLSFSVCFVLLLFKMQFKRNLWKLSSSAPPFAAGIWSKPAPTATSSGVIAVWVPSRMAKGP